MTFHFYTIYDCIVLEMLLIYSCIWPCFIIYLLKSSLSWPSHCFSNMHLTFLHQFTALRKLIQVSTKNNFSIFSSPLSPSLSLSTQKKKKKEKVSNYFCKIWFLPPSLHFLAHAIIIKTPHQSQILLFLCISSFMQTYNCATS